MSFDQLPVDSQWTPNLFFQDKSEGLGEAAGQPLIQAPPTPPTMPSQSTVSMSHPGSQDSRVPSTFPGKQQCPPMLLR